MSRLPHRLPPRLVSALGCFLLALIASAPLCFSPLDRLIGHEDVDATNHAWGAFWWWHSLSLGTFPWRTGLLATPKGGVLWFIDPWGALFGTPLVPLLGSVGAYNLVILFHLSLAAAGGRALARAFGASDRAAWIGAAAAVFSPYLLSEVHNGVSEAVGVGWSSFALAAAWRALRAKTAGDTRLWAKAGLWLGITATGTWYYGLTTGLTIGAWSLILHLRAGERPRAWPSIRGALMAGGIALLIASPVIWLIRQSIRDPDSLVVRGDLDLPTREMLLAHNAVDPRAFVIPGGFQSVDLAAQGEAFLHSSYLGLLPLGLALFALRGSVSLRRALVGLLPAAALSLGPLLWWGGAWLTLGGNRLSLPFGWLTTLLPEAGATHAQRLVWPVVVGIGAMAAVGAEALINRWSAAGRAKGAGTPPRPSGKRSPKAKPADAGKFHWKFLLIGVLVALDLLVSAPWPLARLGVQDMATHRGLGVLARAELIRAEGLPDDEPGVLDLPAEVGNTMATSRYLLYQTASGLPIPYRPDARGGTSPILGFPWFNILYFPSVSRPDQAETVRRAVSRINSVDLREIEELAHIRWIVLHRELERGRGDVARIETTLRGWFGSPAEQGPHLCWDVRSRPRDSVTVQPPR